MINSKNAFWQALIFSIIIFVIGISIGVYFENSRNSLVKENILKSEIDLLDQQIRNNGISKFEISCSQSKKSALEFADKIYKEALQLEKYDATNKFTSTLKIIHKRYDLLRTLLWIEGIEFKKRCPQELHTVIYLFKYDTKDIDTRAKQSSIARQLTDLKEKYGNKILLIPIAGNLEIESINMILDKYNISTLPAIIIDEKKVMEKRVTFKQLEDKVFIGQTKENKKIIEKISLN